MRHPAAITRPLGANAPAGGDEFARVGQLVTEQPSTSTGCMRLHLLATPASGEESACIRARASVIAPRSVGVAWNDAPTLEYSAGSICSSHFSKMDAIAIKTVVLRRPSTAGTRTAAIAAVCCYIYEAWAAGETGKINNKGKVHTQGSCPTWQRVWRPNGASPPAQRAQQLRPPSAAPTAAPPARRPRGAGAARRPHRRVFAP